MDNLDYNTKEQLNKTLDNWIDLSHKIKELKNSATTVRNAQKVVEKQIIELMEENSLTNVRSRDGKTIQLRKNGTKKRVTPKELKDELTKDTISKETRNTVQRVFQELEENRDVTQKKALIQK